MNQAHFEAQRSERWERLAAMLADLELGRSASAEFPRLYRHVCNDLALARERAFDAGLVSQLEGLALRGHQALYGVPPRRTGAFWNTLLEFPRAVRREWRVVAFVSLVLYGCGFGVFAWAMQDPDIVYSIVPPDTAVEFEQMYRDGSEATTARSDSDDLMMFGHYIRNNIGIAFRCFASGIVLGIGSLFMVGYNGFVLGAVAGHLTNSGLGQAFGTFVVGHGSFELTAIVLSAAAGLKLGLALLFPGRRRRLAALQHAAHGALPILYGATAFLVIAAVIEAFWSSRNHLMPSGVFYGVGLVLWVGVGAFLGFAGRRRAS